MNTPTRLLLGLGLAAIVALPAPGTTAPPPTSEEPVRLYTNADLNRLGPATPAPESRSAKARLAAPPVYDRAEADWAFVNAWMEREYARMEAAREPATWSEPADQRPHYGLALAPYAGYGYGYGYAPGYGYGYDHGFDRPGHGRPGHGHRHPGLPAVAPRPLMPLWRPRPLMPLSYTMRPPLSTRR